LAATNRAAPSGHAVVEPARLAGRDEPAGGASVIDGVPLIRMVSPLPGFPGLDTFLLVRLGDDAADAEADPVLFELRSVEQPQVRFLVAVPTAFFPDYTVELDETTSAELELSDADDALVLVILTVGVDPAPTTANLMAPVVLNARTRAGAQVILSGSDWPVRATVA
jgi:flagellar assembly factor FliW